MARGRKRCRSRRDSFLAGVAPPGPRAFFACRAGKGGSKVRVLFWRNHRPEGLVARREKGHGCGTECRCRVAGFDTFSVGDFWCVTGAWVDRERKDSESCGDRRRPLRQEDQSKDGLCGREEI